MATGLVADDVRRLSPAQRRQLVAWTLGKAGGNLRIAPFIPQAIRAMPLEHRLELAGDVKQDAAWEEAERRRVRADWTYFTEGYGSVQPPDGPRIPFALWPEQRELAAELREHLRWIIPKARQLGLTWLCLHDGFHLLAYDEATPNARLLALSRTGGDASKLLMRARTLNANLPPFLRAIEAPDTRRALTRFGILGRGEMISLMGTPDAARMETATWVLLDEFAFYRNKGASRTWTAAESTLGETGRAMIVSTGNGPADTAGDGQAFAELVEKAMGGAETLRLAFLPYSVDPARRGKGWRDRKRESYLSDEEFEAEHPETIDQALQGIPGTKVYPLAGIKAAERYGRELDALREEGKLPPPAAPLRAEIVGIDWGEQTHGLELWPLEGGGFYVIREVAHAHREPSELVEPLLGPPTDTKGRGPVTEAHYDAAGVQSMRTFLATARRTRWPRLRSVKVPFGDFKDESIKYARRLFRRTERLLAERAEWERLRASIDDAADQELPPPPAMRQMIAISPSGCPKLLRQLRGLEFEDDDSGKIDKGDDHGPDALLAGVAKTARRFRAALEDADAADDD